METKAKQWSGANYTPIFEFWVWPVKISRRQGRSIFRWSESRWQQSERHSWSAVGMSPVTSWSGPRSHRPSARVWAAAAVSLKYASSRSFQFARLREKGQFQRSRFRVKQMEGNWNVSLESCSLTLRESGRIRDPEFLQIEIRTSKQQN